MMGKFGSLWWGRDFLWAQIIQWRILWATTGQEVFRLLAEVNIRAVLGGGPVLGITRYDTGPEVPCRVIRVGSDDYLVPLVDPGQEQERRWL